MLIDFQEQLQPFNMKHGLIEDAMSMLIALLKHFDFLGKFVKFPVEGRTQAPPGAASQSKRYLQALRRPKISEFVAADGFIRVIILHTYTFMDLALSVAFMLVVTRRVHLELDTLSRTDPLTQLLNRRALYDAGKVELARMHDHADEMTLLLIDLDHFKRINDSLGHAEGDRVLTDFSAMLKRALPANGHPGRFGGEEFLVLLPNTGMAASLGLAERLRATSSRYFGRRVADLTISIGVACVDKADARLDTAIGRADQALYRAKSGGRNLVEGVMEAA